MKPTIPRKIINPCRGFEEGNWRALSGRRVTSDELRHTGNLQIIKMSNNSTFNALFVEFREAIHAR
jgi:hypothetical protein